MMEVVEDEVKEVRTMEDRSKLQLAAMVCVTALSFGGLIIDGDVGVAVAMAGSGAVGAIVGWLFPSPITKK